MKNIILIFCAAFATITLTAFGYISWNETEIHLDNINKNDLDLHYRVSTRWKSMTKKEIKEINSIVEILNNDAMYKREAFKNVTISILHNDKDVRDIKQFEMGQSEMFNTAQRELLNAVDYSTNLRITALSKRTNIKTGVVEDDSSVVYLTIIPEKEAEFEGGNDALIQYLKKSSKDKTAIIREDQLQPGKVFFTVTKKGTIKHIKIIDTSGYASIDKELVKIISNMPKKWTPAENSKGEKVDQEFVFFFGTQGC